LRHGRHKNKTFGGQGVPSGLLRPNLMTEADTYRKFVMAAGGERRFTLSDVLKVPPISERGNANEIMTRFGGVDRPRTAVNKLQTLLYAT